MYDAIPRYRGRRFREHAEIGAAPTVHLGRARERARLRTRLPPHSMRPATGNWLEFFTGAAPDCGPRPGRTSPALRWSVYAVKPGGRGGFGRGRRGLISDENTSKWTCQNVIFWGHVRSSKRFGRRFCRNRSKKKKYRVLNKFSCNLRSKSARSTLTSPGPIRDNLNRV